MLKPLAIIPVYNEVDIVGWTIEHLLKQGCDVHVIDNWSTDGSLELVESLPVTVETWPEKPPEFYDWTGLLKRIETVAFENKQRWIIFHDADEIRLSPDGITILRSKLDSIYQQGYNAVNYGVKTFWPVDDTYTGDPEKHFEYFTENIDSKLPHVKTWYQGPQKVVLHATGGHDVYFIGRKVYPEKFILKHYPIRTKTQGAKKIFVDRKPRYAPAERSKQWHVQYDHIQNEEQLIADPSKLQRLHE